MTGHLGATAEASGGHYARILVTLLSPIGDTLFATPAIRLLRRTFPDAYIAALAFPTNQGILEGNPDLDRIFTYPTLEWWPGWRYYMGLFRELRSLRFDISVDLCTAFWISRLIIGPRRRVHLRFRPFWWLLPRSAARDTQSHAIYHYMDALRPMKLQEPEPKPYLNPSPKDTGFAEAFMRAWGLEHQVPLIAIHPGGEGFGGKKCWRAEGFASVGEALSRRYGARILLLGGIADQERAHLVAKRIGPAAINGTGATSLLETAALVERCHLFIGNDSSPLHIAASMGTPVVGIYGPSNPANFYPFGVRHAIVQAHRPCAPCFHFVGSVPMWKRTLCSTCEALEDIGVEEVLAAAEQVLSTDYEPAGAI